MEEDIINKINYIIFIYLKIKQLNDNKLEIKKI